MLEVTICQDSIAWDHYVAFHPHAYNQHRWCWQAAIRDTFGHNPYYLAAACDGVLRGVLPLFSIRSRIFGNSLVSVPFFSYGGVLADSPVVEEALLAKAAEVAQQLGAHHVELRQGHPLMSFWQEASGKIGMEVTLPPTADELWNSLSPRIRKRVRHARKAGLTHQMGGIEDVESFYRVFAENMRNLGTPVYPKAWFENLCRQSPEDTRILTLWRGDQVAAGAFLMICREMVELPWAVTAEAHRRDFSPLLLYWSMLEWACGRGFHRVDLGRCTPGSGNHAFKLHWTQQEKPLHWYYWLPHGSSVPSTRVNNSRFGLAIRVWRHLPLAVANRLGPHIVRALP